MTPTFSPRLRSTGSSFSSRVVLPLLCTPLTASTAGRLSACVSASACFCSLYKAKHLHFCTGFYRPAAGGDLHQTVAAHHGGQRTGGVRLGVARAGQGHLAAAGSRPQVAVALAGFGKAIGQGADGAGGDAALLPPPGGAQQRGDSVLLQRSGGGKGVAGQAEYQLAAQRCRQHGAAGLLGYALYQQLGC